MWLITPAGQRLGSRVVPEAAKDPNFDLALQEKKFLYGSVNYAGF